MFIFLFINISPNFFKCSYKKTYIGDKIPDAKDKILMALSEEWKSTNEIANNGGINWYRAEYILNQLFEDDMVEKDAKKSGVKYWKVKSEEEEEETEEEPPETEED